MIWGSEALVKKLIDYEYFSVNKWENQIMKLWYILSHSSLLSTHSQFGPHPTHAPIIITMSTIDCNAHQ